MIAGSYVLLIILATYPLVFNIMTAIPGFSSTDEVFVTVWDNWRIKYSFEHNLSLRITPLIAYPFGLDIYSSGYTAYIWLGLTYLLSIFTTAVLTWNLQILFNIFLSAFLTYLLIFYLLKNRLAAFFGGLAFGFCPYQFMRSWQHLGLTYNELLPLCLFAIILLREKNQKKYKLFFFFSLLMLFSFDFSIMYFGTVIVSSFLIYSMLYQWKRKIFIERQLLVKDYQFVKRAALIGVILFIILLPQFLPLLKNISIHSSLSNASPANPYRRPFHDLFVFSAKPLSYFLPAVVHPILGRITELFVGTSIYGRSLTEHTLYLGWMPLLLAFVAIRKWLQARRKNEYITPGRYSETNENFYIGFFIFLAVVAWFFSQAPWWKMGPFKIYLPSFFMYKILPMYRSYCRFGIVLMLAVAVLAAYGLRFITDRLNSRISKSAVIVLCCSFLLFEFWNWPPFKIIEVSKVPDVYYWLKEKKGDIVIAEYPFYMMDTANVNYRFFQITHEKKMFNGSVPDTRARYIAQSVADLSDTSAAGVLKWLGVTYVLVHRDIYLNTDLIEKVRELNAISQNRGLRLVKNFPGQDCPSTDIMCVQKTGPIDVYEVIADPLEPDVHE